jgi:hypothetical protein
MLADSVCLLIMEIKERATPQLLKMLEVTKQGRVKQELQLKLHCSLMNHFEFIDNVPNDQNQVRISADSSFSSFLTVDLTHLKILDDNQDLAGLREEV